MAWRLWYQPQVGQTTWGSLAAEQRGQMLRAGAASFQFAARRLRPFILLVFFFGTAIRASLLVTGLDEATGLRPEEQSRLRRRSSRSTDEARFARRQSSNRRSSRAA